MRTIGRFNVLVAGLLIGLAGLAANAGAAGSVGFFFYSPSRTVECRFSNGAVACASFRSRKLVVLNPTGAAMTVTVGRGFGSKNSECGIVNDVACWFEPGGRGPALALGRSASDPDSTRHTYRCTSLASGIVCRSLRSGRGFRITSARVVRLAATPR